MSSSRYPSPKIQCNDTTGGRLHRNLPHFSWSRHQPSFPILVYITDALLSAQFKPMGSATFIRRYLLPLDHKIKRTDLRMSYLKRFYENPMPEDIESEAYIQDYFNSEIKPPINSLYKKIDTTSNFGLMRFFAPLTDSVIVESDVVHIWGCKNPPARSYPEMCFAIGDYNRSNYKLNEGFERMMELIRNYQQNPADANQLFFPSRLWTSAVCFTLLLRKYLYQAMICGTNRVFLSDHNTFSGFFEYNFNENGIMNIEYYIIGNPETVSDGITLRSAIAGFFFQHNR